MVHRFKLNDTFPAFFVEQFKKIGFASKLEICFNAASGHRARHNLRSFRKMSLFPDVCPSHHPDPTGGGIRKGCSPFQRETLWKSPLPQLGYFNTGVDKPVELQYPMVQ
jgi:hypothetical protein